MMLPWILILLLVVVITTMEFRIFKLERDVSSLMDGVEPTIIVDEEGKDEMPELRQL